MKQLLRIFWVVALITSLANSQTGRLPFSTFGGGAVDGINLSSLNIHVDIPIYGKAGRGLPFRYMLSFDNALWFKGLNGSTFSWTPMPNYGWRGFTEAFIGYIDYTITPTTCVPSGTPTTKYTGFTYHDTSGGSHFGGNMVDSAGCYGGPHDVEHALDGSGYMIDVTLSGSTISAKVYTPDGATIIPPQYIDTNSWPTTTPIGNGSITDSNGNQLTASVSGSLITLTDTLDTTAMTIDSSNPNAIKYSYTGPDGNPASVIVNYLQYTVKTNFGVTGVTEYAATQALLPSSIVFPDFSSYQFTYEATPGFAPDITGRLASITLPSGGQITYAYDGGNNGVASDGSTTGITRTVGSSIFRYERNIPASGPATTTFTDPNGNQTVFTFSGSHELQRQVYQGTAQSGTLLLTQLTCYNGNTTSCATATVNTSIAAADVYDQLPSGLQSRTTTFYDVQGDLIERDEYDYGNGSPGPLTRKTLTAYASLSNNILGRPASVIVKDGAGNIVSQALFGYDETGVIATSEPQHVVVTGSRGNITSITQSISASTTLIKNFTYYDTGSIAGYTDVNGASISYQYGTNSCNNSYPTGVSFPLGLSVSSAWDCTGGLHTSFTDENGKQTIFGYNTAADPSIWRLKTRTDPLGNIENTIYGLHTNESVVTFNGGSSSSDVLITFDNYGRASTAQIRQGPGNSNFDTVETDYDALGRANRTTASYAGTAGQTNSTIGAATITYDALGRVLTQSGPGGDFAQFTYNGSNDILSQQGPAPTGENLKQKQYEYDGLGRLTSVCEITTMPGSGPCGQNTAATGYLTRYTYDTLNNVLTVTQNAQSSSPQVRSFTYDFISRKTSETAPESGTVTYVYDSDPTGVCATSNLGDLVRRVDAAGVSTCYIYDSRRRMTSAISGGLGAVSISGSEQSKTVTTPGTATITVSGTEQSVPGTPPVAGYGSVTIQGARQSKVDTGDCRLINHIWVCQTIYDHGSVTLTVNGVPGSCSYSQTLNTTSSAMASCLAGAITNATGSPVTASASGSTINMTARTAGASTNYAFSVGSSYDTVDFSSPSYTGSPASGSLANGADAGPPTYDSGTVTATIGSFTARASYGQNDTASLVASRLVNDPTTGLNIASSPVTATINGNVISLTAKDTSTYTLSTGSSSSNGFSPPSFSASPSGSSITPVSQLSHDTGTVSITVGSSVASVTYGQNDTVTTIANNLASTINGNSGYPATASVLYPTRVVLIPKQSGNYSLSATSSTTNGNFSSPSFNAQAASASGIDESRQTKFIYDSATVNGQTMANTKGRLAEAITCVSNCTGANIITDLGFSYDALGNLSDTYQSTPHSGGYYHLTATYWPNGMLNTLSGLPGLAAFTFQPDSEGRISTISASTGQNPVTSTNFNVSSQVTGVTFGSGDSDTYTIDGTTGQMTQFVASVGSQTLTGALTWNTNGSLANLGITDQFNSSNNQNCAYAYDDLARLASVNCGTVWSQTFSYDAFGNISKSGSVAFQPVYSTATNHIQSLPGVTPTYNANGALTNDGAHSYNWDADGNLTSVDTVGLTFDAMGRMVEQARGSSYTQIVYSPAGDKLALMNGQSLQKAFLPLPGGATAVYDSTGLIYYRHPDWLGSSRLASTPARAVYSKTSYGPFGEPYNQSGTADLSFTGKNQDTVSGLYDFLYREYSPVQGRWVTCDPMGSSAASVADPQSWNKYTYGLNNPLAMTDPNGLDDVSTELPPCKNLIIMGITNTSSMDGGKWDMRRAEQLAAQYGYNIAFPYSGLDTMQSLGDMKSQGGGNTTAATTTVSDALKTTFENGGTSVISISGGAQAYASAMRDFNSTPGYEGSSSRISSIVYLSPGLRGGVQLVRGTTSTERYSAHGAIDGFVNLTATSPAGTVTNRGSLDCPRHWAVCELEEFLKKKCGGGKCKHGPCSSQVFSRGKGSRENPGEAPPPPDDPGYRIGEWCTYTREDVHCYFFVYWDWGWLGAYDNPGGGAWGFPWGRSPFW